MNKTNKDNILRMPPALNKLIHAIYSGLLEDAAGNSFLNELLALYDAEYARMMIVPGNQQGDRFLFNQVAAKEEQLVDFSKQWSAYDPFENISCDTPSIEPENAKKVINHPKSYAMGINISGNSSPGLLLKLRIARPAHYGNFSPEEQAMLGGLIEHIKLALRFFDHMAIQQIERNAFADAINQMLLGTLILDSAGTIVASNRVARDSIEQYKSFAIKDGCLVIADRKANRQLYETLKTIEQNINNEDAINQTVTINLGQSQSLALMVRPIRPEDAETYPIHAHAVVFISNLQGTPEISSNTLKELFTLTETESKVAAFLANGYTLNEAAEALSVSINTAKTHARNIYEKTGVNKQTKFIQLVSNSVARVS